MHEKLGINGALQMAKDIESIAGKGFARLPLAERDMLAKIKSGDLEGAMKAVENGEGSLKLYREHPEVAATVQIQMIFHGLNPTFEINRLWSYLNALNELGLKMDSFVKKKQS